MLDKTPQSDETVLDESVLPNVDSGDAELTPSATTDEVEDRGETDTDKPRKRWRRVRWVFTRRLAFGGLAGALVFFVVSMTPSLVPRTWLFQAVVSGVSLSIGYGLGSALSALTR